MNYEMKSKLEGLGRGGGDEVTQSLFRGTSCVGEPQVRRFIDNRQELYDSSLTRRVP